VAGLTRGGASVHIENVRKRYGSHEVLKGISIDVPPGSFTTLLGPSGSGKTTTLAITTGLVNPDSGIVRIGGVDCTRMAVNKRNLGFVFQSYALFPHMTIEKNIAFPLKLRKVGRAEIKRRVGEALELVRLRGYEKRFPSQLSGGQQQRVALARAVVFQPQVLLMDEPLGALDAGLRAHLQREIVRIGRELGVTILYVTHDQDEALSMSDQIVLFNDGTIEQIGSPTAVYTSPASSFVAGFMGSGTLVNGVLERRDHAVVRSETGLRVPVDARSCDAHHLADGARAVAVVRPECTSVSTADLNGSGITLGEGTVTDIIYNGARVRVRVSIGSGHEFETHLDAVRAAHYQLGDRAVVTISATNLPIVVPQSHDAGPAVERTAGERELELVAEA